ncbi:hypothetical protein LNTAR_23669 [Lentisphaera araneosa HTCC2155]|uniref:Uncharacterized protein n=1 Tax=Lentisphaera araneosa HTCC2155 TaxID=313628 RepID=A6DS61_9BACT|nr:hypothetical protein LNTAR_23669 [Lentisphaera araneosa HTCC2155]
MCSAIRHAEVRALIVAMKVVKVTGAKGGRKVKLRRKE